MSRLSTYRTSTVTSYMLHTVSNYRQRHCLFSSLNTWSLLPFSIDWHRRKHRCKLHIIGSWGGNLPVTVDFPHKGPVMRKEFQCHAHDAFILLYSSGGMITITRLIQSLLLCVKNEVIRVRPWVIKIFSFPKVYLTVIYSIPSQELVTMMATISDWFLPTSSTTHDQILPIP